METGELTLAAHFGRFSWHIFSGYSGLLTRNGGLSLVSILVIYGRGLGYWWHILTHFECFSFTLFPEWNTPPPLECCSLHLRNYLDSKRKVRGFFRRSSFILVWNRNSWWGGGGRDLPPWIWIYTGCTRLQVIYRLNCQYPRKLLILCSLQNFHESIASFREYF